VRFPEVSSLPMGCYWERLGLLQVLCHLLTDALDALEAIKKASDACV